MNKKHTFFLKLALSACVGILAVGCSNTMRLQYVKPPLKEMNKGKVYVVVDDQRLPDRGGDDPTRVGTIRNTFGMPFPLKASANREPSKVIQELISDCLKAAGYEISEQPDKVPQLHVALQAFWSDGYQHSRIGTTIPVELKKDRNSKPVWQHIFESNIGVTWKAGYGPFDRGINSMLEEVKNKMIAEFEDPSFYKSLKSL
jgi:hypothetical protein